MKKKIMIFLCLAVMAGSIAACAERETASDGKEQIGQSSEGTAEEEADEYPKDRFHEYIDPDYGFKVYLPLRWDRDHYSWKTGNKEPYSPHAAFWSTEYGNKLKETYYLMITKYSGDVGDEEQKERIDMSQYKDSKDILDLLIGNFASEKCYYEEEIDESKKDYCRIVDYDVEILETKEINGCEATKFEGTLTYEYKFSYSEDLDTYTICYVAYGIKTKQTPVLLLLTHYLSLDYLAEDQVEAVIEAYKAGQRDYLDEIVASFREGE